MKKQVTLKSGLNLPSPIVLPGPMEGVMSPLFCKAVNDLNLTGIWITPFLRVTTGPVRKINISRFIAPFYSSGKPVILQLMGMTPKYMIETAKRAAELGVAGVNFNLACPSKQVTRKGCGGALLKNEVFIEELLDRTSELPDNFSVSLKIRSGVDSTSDILPLSQILKGRRIDFIAFHYRTVKEGYKKVPNRNERIKKAATLFSGIPLIANGDISSHRDAEEVTRATGCAGVMAARGWLKNPYLLREISEGENPRREVEQRHLAEFIHSMASRITENDIKRSRNALIDFLHYIFDADHPFFKYAIKTPFEDIDKELSLETVMQYILP